MGAERILIVDDNPMNLKLARVTLDGLGYRIATASSAETALVQVDAERPDLILLDIQLPGMDGLTLARTLKEDPATRDIGIIAVTAFASPADERRAFAAGCDGFVCKPIDTRAFPQAIAATLAARRAELSSPATSTATGAHPPPA